MHIIYRIIPSPLGVNKLCEGSPANQEGAYRWGLFPRLAVGSTSIDALLLVWVLYRAHSLYPSVYTFFSRFKTTTVPII